MSICEIQNIEDLIFTFVNKQDFVSISIDQLTAPGENYCSLILAVDITVRDNQNQKVIRTVAKLLPRNDFARKLFQSERTFFLEVKYYKTIAPCLRRFQQEQGFTNLLNSFPDFCASRYNLDGSENIDENAVLLLKNLKDEGFGIADRKTGFDFEQSKMVLEKMAELHATVNGLKTLKPEVFQSEFGDVFKEFPMYQTSKEEAQKFIESLLTLVKDDDFCIQNMKRIRDTLNINISHGHLKNNKELAKSPFASLLHNDMWTNNIMVKIVGGKITDVKFIDYQIYEFSSLARDVIFFIFTSVQLPVIQKECDNLFAYYYQCFISYLTKLKCDVSIFTFEGFMAEVASMVKKVELFHIFLMLKPLYREEENAKRVENMTQEDFFQEDKASEKCKQKAAYVVREFIKRGWM